MIEKQNGKSISITVDGDVFFVPEKITIKKALEICGYKLCEFPGESDLFAPAE